VSAEYDGEQPDARTMAVGSDGVDGSLAKAVDEAIIGDPLEGVAEAQPARRLEPRDFASLFIRHRWAMKCHARRFLTDPGDIEDVVQETFLRLFLAIDELETERQALAFERRVLTNLCIDRYRRDKRRPAVVVLDSDHLEETIAAAEDADPVIQAEDAAVVRDAMARLSPLHRAVLVKREIEEKSLPLIAEELGIAEQSVKHVLYRARRALHRLLVGTSVEPAIELPSTREALAVANRRLGRATLSSAQALIVFVAAALTVGGAWQVRHLQTVAEPLAVPSHSAAAPSIGSPPSHHGGKAAGSHHPKPGVAATTGTTAASSGPTGVTVAPVHKPAPPSHHPVSHPTRHPSPPAPTAGASTTPAVQITGSVTPVGTAKISNQVVSVAPNAATALSRVSAPVQGGGSFVLDQTLLLGDDAPPTLQLNAQVTNSSGQSVQSSPSTTTPSVTGDDNSQVTVAGEGIASDGLTVNVLIVYSADLAQIENETVSVGAVTTAAPTPSVASGGTGTGAAQPTPSVPVSEIRQNNLVG
jgi:RNA polymerase sigma factor (sigma-70 family)